MKSVRRVPVVFAKKCFCEGCSNPAELSIFSPNMDDYCHDPCTLERHDIPDEEGPFHAYHA